MLIEECPAHHCVQYMFRQRRCPVGHFIQTPGFQQSPCTLQMSRSLASWSWSPATVSLACALPYPWDHRCSRKSQTNGSSWVRCLGKTKLFWCKNLRNSSMALLYRAFVAGCTVKSRRGPSRWRCFALSDCDPPSRIRLGMSKLGFDLPPPPTWLVGRVLVSVDVAP